MNKSPIKYFLFLIILITLGASCEKFFTDPGPQPNFVEKLQYTPMLNVLGVIRTDNEHGVSNSFVHVEYTTSVTEEYPDSLYIYDANVMVYSLDNEVIADSCFFQYTSFDSVFDFQEYRSGIFRPKAGQKYLLKCQYPGYPTLTATTTVPEKPVLLTETIKTENNNFSFSIKRDTDAILYEVYLWIGDRAYQTKALRPEAGDISVTLEIGKFKPLRGWLLIYAYDKNMSNYLTSNITIKPNTYLPSFSTVENGYGCFGSLNYLLQEVAF